MAKKKTAAKNPNLITTIIVYNDLPYTIKVKITKQGGPGSTDWFTIASGGSDVWNRTMFTTVTVKAKKASNGSSLGDEDHFLNVATLVITFEDKKGSATMSRKRKRPH